MSRITVSNGAELFRIEPSDLAKAEKDGFYRPADRGQAIVANEQFLFEIPIEEIEVAREDGLRQVLIEQRGAVPKQLGRAEPPHESGTKHTASTVDALHASHRIPDASVLLNGLSESEREAEEERLRAEQELAEATGAKKIWLRIKMGWDARHATLSRQLRGNGISAAVHVALLLILASLILHVDEEPKGIVLESNPAAEESIEEAVFEPTPLEITEPTESEDSEAPVESEVVKAEVVAVPDFTGAIRGDAVKPPARPASDGTGSARAMKKASFFGKRVAAVEYVFVIDNSNSMTGGRFETALNELLIAVNQLTPRQRFFVIFYSDMAYPMFHPTPARQLLPATPRNKELLRKWLTSVELCLRTNGKQAIEAAFALDPDVIFVLGDGAFTDKASQYFASRPQSKIPLHTLGMEVKPSSAASFQLLAESNGGTYKDVGVAPGAREIFKINPRPRNSKRGPIWGLALKP